MKFHSHKEKSRNIDKNNKISTRRSLLFILSYIKRYLRRIIPGIVFLIVVDLIQIFIPRIVQKIIDQLSQENFSISVINKYTIIIIFLAVAMVIIRFLWRILIIGSARRIERDLREDMFGHIQFLDFTFFNKASTGSLLALMTNDVNAVRMAAGPTLIGLTDIFFMGVLSLIFMLKIDVKLTLLVISPLPLIAFVMIKFGPEIVKRYKRVQEYFANLSKASQDAFSGIRVIKGFSAEEYELNRFGNECEKYVDANISFVKLWGLFFPIVTLLASISMVILLLAGGKGVIVKRLTFGQFLSFSMYINLIIWPIAAVGWVFSLLQRGVASASRILDLFDNEKEKNDIDILDSDSKLTKSTGKGEFINKKHNYSRDYIFKGEIEYRDIRFSYSKDEQLVLRNLNLVIKSGLKFGIIGKPGSGKSTLISLIFRLFPNYKGKIFLDGIDIERIPLSVIRRKIGFAPQDPFLFSDTILNNIFFGNQNLDPEKAKRLTKIVQIYDEIMDFKDGFETYVGERGVALSGGQIQRISLARALAIDPDILIMDDALSQVDSSKEITIMNNIFEVMKEKTAIVVSNRITTLMKCDKIAVIDNGTIIEIGTHDKLIKSKGYYSKIYELQRFEGNL